MTNPRVSKTRTSHVWVVEMKSPQSLRWIPLDGDCYEHNAKENMAKRVADFPQIKFRIRKYVRQPS